MTHIKKLEKNMSMLTSDILVMTKMIERYATCKSESLVESSEHMLIARRAMIEKRNQLIKKHHELVFEEDDCLQDYREVLA